MPETKEFKTIEQQINALDERKLKFKNKTKAREILSKYNYDVGVKSTLHLILVLWQLNKAMF